MAFGLNMKKWMTTAASFDTSEHRGRFSINFPRGEKHEMRKTQREADTKKLLDCHSALNSVVESNKLKLVLK